MEVTTKTMDPVCKMEVDPKTAPTSTYMGQTYYFCGQEDKKTFDASPEKYAGSSASSGSSSSRSSGNQ